MRREIRIPAPPADLRCKIGLHRWGYGAVTGLKARGPYRRICVRCDRYEAQGLWPPNLNPHWGQS